MERINELFGIKKDPVTGKRYVGKKPGDDQAPDTAGSGTPEEPKGMNFSLGGVDPSTRKPFLGVQPGRDPLTSLSGRLSNALLPRLDKETGRLYMGQQVGRDKKVDATPQTDNVKSAVDQISKDSGKQTTSFGAAFKAAREARLKGGDENFTWQGKSYSSYQKGETKSSAKPASAVPAASTGTAGTPAASSATPDSKSRFSDTLVTQDTKVTPGENSTTTTQSGGKTSTVTVSGGGSTELKLNDRRTADQKKSDEAKDAAEKDATIAKARNRYDDMVAGGVMKSLPSSYKTKLKEALNEARNQRFTDADIERQAAESRGQTYDRNNPEHRRWADSLRKNYQSKGRYIPPEQPKVQTTAKQVNDFVRSAAASASQQTRDDVRARTDRAAREQVARNSASARAQARPGSYGSRTSSAGTTGQQARVNPATQYSLKNVGNVAKSVFAPKNLAKIGAGGLVGGLTTAIVNVAMDDAEYQANKMKEKGQDAWAAVRRNAPDAAGWVVGGAAFDKVGDVLDKTKQVKPSIGSVRSTVDALKSVRSTADALEFAKKFKNVGRGFGYLAGASAADYLDTKAERNPALKPVAQIAGGTARGAAWGAGIGGTTGAMIGGAGGFGVGVGNALNDTKAGKAINLGVQDTAAKITGLAAKEREATRPTTQKDIEDYKKSKAYADAQKRRGLSPDVVKSTSAVDRLRARQQAPGSGVLKNPPKTP